MEAFGYWKFPLIHHVGFHLGGGLGIDNAPGTGISLRCLQGFDHSWSLGDLQSTMRTLQRAVSRLGENAYCPLLNNCQDFVTWCSTGWATSWQAGLRIVGGSTLVGAAVGGPCGAGLGAAIGSLLALVRDLIANLKPATGSSPISIPSPALLGFCPSGGTLHVEPSVQEAVRRPHQAVRPAVSRLDYLFEKWQREEEERKEREEKEREWQDAWNETMWQLRKRKEEEEERERRQEKERVLRLLSTPF